LGRSSAGGSGPTSTATTEAPSTGSTTAPPSSTGSTDATEGTTIGSTGESIPGECGNGIVDCGEQCDLGPENADDGACTTDCLKPRCGDGLLQPDFGEECDFGEEVNNDSGACLTTCTAASCGDGHTWLGVEECDLGEENQDGLYGGCTPMTCTLGPHCGDGAVQKPHEECDLGEENGEPGGPCTEQCKFGGRLVFVTSKSYTGAIGLGGVDGANDACNTVVMEAGLANAGNFRAWISDSEMSPSKWDPPPEGPFVLANATTVAETWADLVDGSLAAKINIHETGSALSELPHFAWTGTSPAGKVLASTCVGWTNGTKNKLGIQGHLLATDGKWSNAESVPCWGTGRLICVEQ